MRITTYDRQRAEPTTAGGAPVGQGAGVANAGLAQAYGQVGEATILLAKRMQDAQRTNTVALRGLEARKLYGQWYAQRSTDPYGYGSLVEESDKALTEISEAVLRDVDDPLARTALQRDLYEYATAQGIEARKHAITQGVEHSRSVLHDTLAETRSEIARTANPHEKMRLQMRTTEYIAANVAHGVITPLDGSKMARGFADDVFEDEINLQVYEKPDEVLEAIYSGAYPDIGEDARTRVIVNAEKRSEALRQQRLADRRRDEAASRRIFEDAQSYTFGEMYPAAASGRMTKADASTAYHSRQIDERHYKTLWDTIDTLERAGGPGNPQTARALRYRAWGGELSVTEILNATEDLGGLSKDETNELVDLVARGSIATQTDEYKEAVKYLDNQLGGIGIGGAFIDAEQAAAASAARREMWTRVTAHPEVRPMNVVDEIVKRYKTFEVNRPPVKPRYRTPELAWEAFKLNHIKLEELNVELKLHERGAPRDGQP